MASFKKDMNHHGHRSHRHNCGKYSQIIRKAVDYEGKRGFLHRSHRTDKSPNLPPKDRHNRRKEIIAELEELELFRGLDYEIKKCLKI